MKKIQNSAGMIFIFCTALLAVVSILGIWKILSDDVVGKSMQTIGLLSVVAIIVIVAGRFIDAKAQPISIGAEGVEVPVVPEINPAFSSIRHGTVALLVTSVSMLALFGVLSIWDVLSGEVLGKSMASIAIVAFASLVIIVTCLERENHKLIRTKFSGWAIFLIIIFLWPLFSLLLRGL